MLVRNQCVKDSSDNNDKYSGRNTAKQLIMSGFPTIMS